MKVIGTWLLMVIIAIAVLRIGAYFLDHHQVWVTQAAETEPLTPYRVVQPIPHTKVAPTVHYRCTRVGHLTVLEPVDCLDCKPIAIACVNCECGEEK